MKRVKIDLPENFSFSTSIKIRVTDLNYGGHVGNDSFLSLIHEARLQYLKYFGYSELEIEGTSLIMSDVEIEFKKELSYSDEVKISVTTNGFDRFGFDLFYKLELNSNESFILAAKAKTGMLCYNYQTKKLTALPEKLKSVLI